MASEAGLGADIDLGAGVGPKKLRLGEPRIVVSGTLAGPLSFMIASLRAKSLSGSLGTAELCWGFF